METTFISIHDLSLDARIKYVSDSVEDILGYTGREIVGKSCWEYFHPDEIPFARAVHGRGIQLDKAAVLNYCKIKHRDGYWVSCECAFSIVYNVLVACTSIYQRGFKSEKRAYEAPVIRRLFSSSPRDPRYHMLSYISSKFSQEPKNHIHEPRAALFLNRFTRTLTIMFATNGLDAILGVPADQLQGKSFYYCIAEECLADAIRCLEAAKANDSIAYLRFWFRNPLQEETNEDALMEDSRSSDSDQDDGGVHLADPHGGREDSTGGQVVQSDPPQSISLADGLEQVGIDDQATNGLPTHQFSRSSSGNSSAVQNTGSGTIFDGPAHAVSSTSSVTRDANAEEHLRTQRTQRAPPPGPVEVEAVVSCTSDGLVVILRRARVMIPQTLQHTAPQPAIQQAYHPGLFAAPWALDPINPPPFDPQPQHEWNVNYGPAPPYQATAPQPAPTAKATMDVMNTIREVAVFAWGLMGINGSLGKYSHGSPLGEATPPGGVPIWDPTTNEDPDNLYNGYMDNTNRRVPLSHQSSSDPNTISSSTGSGSGSDNEVVWRRAPEMPAWQPVDRSGSAQHGESGVNPTNWSGSEEDENALRRMRLI